MTLGFWCKAEGQFRLLPEKGSRSSQTRRDTVHPVRRWVDYEVGVARSVATEVAAVDTPPEISG